MKKVLLLTGIILSCMTACNSPVDSIYPVPSPIKEIIFSRSLQDSTTIADGTTALFHSKGGLNVDQVTLTYTNGKWIAADSLLWEIPSDTSYYTALIPAYNDYSYVSGNLYTDNGLEDILIAQDSLVSSSNIELTFKHLFSRLNVHIGTSIHEKLVELRMTVPITVANLSKEGYITYTESPQTTVLPKQGSPVYSFILPPMKERQLRMEVITTENSYTIELPSYTFESHMSYECNVRNSIGIQNAEDLIAFSQLINGRTYTGKSLENFGEKVGNDTVFYLLNDIELTAEDCSRLLPIGYDGNHAFSYIFEGNNHTISHLTTPDRSINSLVNNSYSGLFGHISSSGIVRNLQLANASTVTTPLSKQTGILCAQNYGCIINCAVKGSKILLGSNSETQAFISASNSGYIINCWVENCNITVADVCKTGAIAGNAIGYILNCYAYKNTFVLDKDSYIGGLVGMSNINKKLDIHNCCVYHAKEYNNFGSIIGNSRSATISHVFYNNGTVYNATSNSTITNHYKYGSTYHINNKHLSTYLNEWIDSIGVTAYPTIEFKKWNTETTVFPTFQ